jgi:hypothetical protein
MFAIAQGSEKLLKGLQNSDFVKNMSQRETQNSITVQNIPRGSKFYKYILLTMHKVWQLIK